MGHLGIRGVPRLVFEIGPARAVSPQVPSAPSKLNHHGTTASKREAADESGWKRAGSFNAASELSKAAAGTRTTG